MSCEAEASCKVKLATIKGGTHRCSGVYLGFFGPYCGWVCKLVGDVRGKVVVGVRGLVRGVVVERFQEHRMIGKLKPILSAKWSSI